MGRPVIVRRKVHRSETRHGRRPKQLLDGGVGVALRIKQRLGRAQDALALFVRAGRGGLLPAGGLHGGLLFHGCPLRDGCFIPMGSIVLPSGIYWQDAGGCGHPEKTLSGRQEPAIPDTSETTPCLLPHRSCRCTNTCAATRAKRPTASPTSGTASPSRGRSSTPLAMHLPRACRRWVWPRASPWHCS